MTACRCPQRPGRRPRRPTTAASASARPCPAAQPRGRGVACSARCCCRARRSARSASWACARRLLQAGPPAHLRRRSARCTRPGEPVDTVTVADELRRAGLLDEIGGAETLHELQNATPAISNAGHYAKIVQDTALLRRLIGVAGEIAEIALQRARRRHQGARRGRDQGLQGRRATGSPTRTPPLGELLPRRWTSSRRRYERGDTSPASPPATHDLDELLSGLQPSDAEHRRRPARRWARPRSASGMATHVAQHGRQAGAGLLARDGPHRADPAHPVERGRGRLARSCAPASSAETDWAKIGRAIGRLEVPLFLDDNPHVTVMEIRAKARRHQGPPRRPRPDRRSTTCS